MPRNAPSEDRKCWQRVELGIHGWRSWGRNWSRKVRETRNSGDLQGYEASRPLRSPPSDFPGLSSRHPGGLDGLSTEYSQQLASSMTLNCQQFDDVSLIAAIGISYRQRLFVEHDLGGSSGSAVDAARRAGYSTPHQAGGQHATKCYVLRFREKFGELNSWRKLLQGMNFSTSRISAPGGLSHNCCWYTSFGWRTKPLRGGKDPGLVHKPSASATRPIDSDFAPCLYQRAAPCYSSAWLRLAAVSVRFFTSRSPGTLPRTRPLPIYSIYIKAKAVPVAASSSEIASARPTGPELRPRSFTALRIQHSSED